MKNYPDQLTRVPLFDGVDRGELEELLDCLGARVRTYQKGEMVFREGDPAGIIGVVLSGRWPPSVRLNCPARPWPLPGRRRCR